MLGAPSFVGVVLTLVSFVLIVAALEFSLVALELIVAALELSLIVLELVYLVTLRLAFVGLLALIDPLCGRLVAVGFPPS